MTKPFKIKTDIPGYILSEILPFAADIHGGTRVFPALRKQDFERLPKESLRNPITFGSRKYGSRSGLLHFYTDDHRFEKVWLKPNITENYGFDYVISPDFSLLPCHPYPIQLFQVYRNRVLAAYWQEYLDLNVIFSLSWGEPETYEFCFDEFPLNSVVSVKCPRSDKILDLWLQGFEVMIAKCLPVHVVVCGRLANSAKALLSQYAITYDEFPCFFDARRDDNTVKDTVANLSL